MVQPKILLFKYQLRELVEPEVVEVVLQQVDQHRQIDLLVQTEVLILVAPEVLELLEHAEVVVAVVLEPHLVLQEVR